MMDARKAMILGLGFGCRPLAGLVWLRACYGFIEFRFVRLLWRLGLMGLSGFRSV